MQFNSDLLKTRTSFKFKLQNPCNVFVNTAGHATTLLRKRDHVFRPQRLLVTALLLYSLFLLHLDTETLIFFLFFCSLRLITLSFCRVVAKLKNCRVPSSSCAPFLRYRRVFTVYSVWKIISQPIQRPRHNLNVHYPSDGLGVAVA